MLLDGHGGVGRARVLARVGVDQRILAERLRGRVGDGRDGEGDRGAGRVGECLGTDQLSAAGWEFVDCGEHWTAIGAISDTRYARESRTSDGEPYARVGMTVDGAWRCERVMFPSELGQAMTMGVCAEGQT